MIEKGQRLHPGDILRNDWAGESNPARFTMYFRRGNSSIDCIAYNGAIQRFTSVGNRLVVVGHIDEYDAFMKALSKLKDGVQE